MAPVPDGFVPDTPEGFVPDDPPQKPQVIYSNRPTPPSDSGAIGMWGSSAAFRPAVTALYDFGTNPAVPKMTAAAGRVIGGVAAPVMGAVEGGPWGAAVGAAEASKAAWAGGKTGYFTGKLAQDVTRPVAAALDKVAPYVQTLSTLSGAQGVLDLAQMVDPKRQDIGFLGIGASPTPESRHMTPEQSAQYDQIHPAFLNMIAGKVTDGIKSLMDLGLSKADAVEALMGITKPRQGQP